MNRNEWEFEYTASKVADGAEAQASFRRSRLGVWEAKYNETLAEIRASGINVEESAARGMSNYTSTHAMSPRVVVDEGLERRLTECHQKIERHRSAANEYDGWVQVLRANPEQRLKLTQADWLYFFGKAP